MSGYMSQETLVALKQSRFGDLLCHDCTFKMAGRMSGRAFTAYECKRCKRGCSHHTTSTPNYCKGCAFESFSCQRCMQSLEKDIVDDKVSMIDIKGIYSPVEGIKEKIIDWIIENHEHHEGAERAEASLDNSDSATHKADYLCSVGNYPYVNTIEFEKFVRSL